MEIVNYKGWPNCYRLRHGQIELVVTADVGPRVIRFGLVGQANEFYENETWLGRVATAEWVNYGGHRFWYAPEAYPRTYQPDNAPVTVENHGAFVRFIQVVDTATGLQKEIDISLHNHVKITHRLYNRTLWPLEVAPWAISVMAAGGVAIIPLPPRGSHTENLLPTTPLTLWAYSHMNDPRWTWGQRFILLRQDTTAITPQKLGLPVPSGWAAYARAGHLFVKQVAHNPQATYPDFGSSMEFFTDAQILEVESLAPLARLEPNQAVEHEERWWLFDQVPQPHTEAEVEQSVLPLIQSILL